MKIPWLLSVSNDGVLDGLGLVCVLDDWACEHGVNPQGALCSGVLCAS